MDTSDPQDFLCPITLQEYTTLNPPITLPCGHTLSLEAFQRSRDSKNNCPICRTFIHERYTPQKNYLLAKLMENTKGNFWIKCSTHKEENAIAICINDKIYLCVKCLKNDKCPEESIIPKEKFKAYLLEEATKINEKENEVLQGLLSDVKINQEVFSLVNPLLVDIVKWELSKQHHARNLKEKQGLTKEILNYGNSQINEGKIKVLNNIETRYKNLNELKTEEETSKRNLEANKIAKRKLISLLCEEPIKISIDNSLKEMKENVDKESSEKLEVSFKEGFNNRDNFFKELEELVNLQSLSLHNLAAFEHFGIRDLAKLAPICQKLILLNLDFTGVQRNLNEASGLQKFFAALRAKKSIKTLQLSFKQSNFAFKNDFKYLRKFLLSSENLSTVTLNLEKCKEAISYGVQKLFETATRFNEFNLNLLNCPDLDQETLKRLTKYFWRVDPKLNHFKALSLKLGHSQLISNSWLQSFSDYLRQMRISKLTLHFQACSDIGYQGLNHLISAISQIGGLKELDLSFIGCKSLTGVRVLKNLSQCMKKLQKLKVFILCIKGCPRFHFDGLEKFRNEIKNVPVVELDCTNGEKNKVDDLIVLC